MNMGKRTEHGAPTILGRSKPGQESGFAALAFDQFHDGLHRYLLRRLHSSENAADLAQEVYLRLLRFADDELIRCPEAYVYRVAFNVLYEFKLHERRNRVAFDSEALEQITEKLPDEAASPDELCDQQRRERRLEEVLGELPPMQRSVFLLAKRQDMPHEEIASKLDLSMHTVRKYLYRTLHYCRQRISGTAQESESP